MGAACQSRCRPPPSTSWARWAATRVTWCQAPDIKILSGGGSPRLVSHYRSAEARHCCPIPPRWQLLPLPHAAPEQQLSIVDRSSGFTLRPSLRHSRLPTVVEPELPTPPSRLPTVPSPRQGAGNLLYRARAPLCSFFIADHP
jgi:hypothetical protein